MANVAAVHPPSYECTWEVSLGAQEAVLSNFPFLNSFPKR